MLFSSITFLYYYMPIVLGLYFLCPKKLRNFELLIASLVFYAWGEPKYVILMIVSVISGYIFGLLIEKYRETKKAKLFTFISIAISLSFLVYFKYADFFISNFNKALGLSIPLLKIALPIGISFYTFQIVSYTVDVYRGEKAQRSLINLGAYISMFPQLIAGPIVRYSDIAKQLETREHSIAMASEGIRRFTIGLAKKILLANQLGEITNIFRLSGEKSVAFYWLYAVAFALHIYFDFSGYSDMAIGLGKIMGFNFLENFNYPFISKNVTEFWRRWHMSLGSWFRDYVYIPLGGNKKGKGRQLFNIFVVWMLTGFWHGADWNFIIWGLFFAVLLIFEKLWLLERLKKHIIISRIYIVLVSLVSFVIFNAAGLEGAVSDLGGLIGMGGIPLVSDEFFYTLKSFAGILIISCIGATPVVKNFFLKLQAQPKYEKVLNILEPVTIIVLLFVMTAYLVDGSFNPFLYFRF